MLLPVVMLLLMVVVQAGVYFHTRAVATTAARKAVTAARIEEGTPADGQQAAEHVGRDRQRADAADHIGRAHDERAGLAGDREAGDAERAAVDVAGVGQQA